MSTLPWDGDPATARILGRVCRAHGVALHRNDDEHYGWLLEFPIEASVTRSLRLGITRDADDRIVVANDGPWPDATEESCRDVAALLTDLSACLAQEAIRFVDFEALATHLIEHSGGERDEGDVVVLRLRSVHVPFLVYETSVAGEPWVTWSVHVAHESDVDPSWAIQMNARLAYASLSWVTELERYELTYTFPLAEVTAARFDEVIMDLKMLWQGLTDELEQ